MKCKIVQTTFLVATLLGTLPAFALENDDRTCSSAGVAGLWGYSETGTLYLSPTGIAVPYSSVGEYTLDAYGNLSGARTASVGGTIQHATIKGTATVNPDCTGTLTLGFYDQSGNLASTAVKFLVYVDNAREARAIITSVALANGTALSAVLITDAKKQFSHNGNKQDD